MPADIDRDCERVRRTRLIEFIRFCTHPLAGSTGGGRVDGQFSVGCGRRRFRHRCARFLRCHPVQAGSTDLQDRWLLQPCRRWRCRSVHPRRAGRCTRCADLRSRRSHVLFDPRRGAVPQRGGPARLRRVAALRRGTMGRVWRGTVRYAQSQQRQRTRPAGYRGDHRHFHRLVAGADADGGTRSEADARHAPICARPAGLGLFSAA